MNNPRLWGRMMKRLRIIKNETVEIVDGDIAEFLPFMEDKTNVISLHPEAHAASNDGGDNE